MNYFIIGFYALLIGASSLAAFYQKRTPFLLLFSLTLVSFIMGIVGGDQDEDEYDDENDVYYDDDDDPDAEQDEGGRRQ